MRYLLIAVLALAACFTDEEEAAHVLKGAGFTEIQFTGYKMYGCSEDDFYHTGFRAKGPTGVRVSGVVCCGGPAAWSKSCTIRME